MQTLISLPAIEELEDEGGMQHALFRKVCGVPLLERVITTACRNGATEVILLHPKSLPATQLKSQLKSARLSPFAIHTFTLDIAFDPDKASDWRAIEEQLKPKFLWLPWNYVADKKALSRLMETGKATDRGARLGGIEPNSGMPAVIVREKLRKVASSTGGEKGATLKQYLIGADVEIVSFPGSPGVTVHSSQTARQAERELVRRSGKDSDGIYSKANRWLVRPVVRWLSKTPVTPNIVSFTGMAAALFAGYLFAQGYWTAYVLGALLYFMSVLFDEMDGMLARMTFRESAFGCWLETFVDYTNYILLFVGMTIGLYRENGPLWLVFGGLLLFGTLTSFWVLIRQRKLATDPDRPHEYRQRLHRRLETDSGNVLSRFGRLAEPLARNGVFCYYVLIFTVLGGLKVLFLLAAFGSNLVWILALHFNRLFRHPTSVAQPGESCSPSSCP